MTKAEKINSSNMWTVLRHEAALSVKKESAMAAVMKSHILLHENFGDALAYVLAVRLGDKASLSNEILFAHFKKIYADNKEIVGAAKRDLLAVMERDPAVANARAVFMNYKGYHALQAHRIAHHMWHNKRHDFALHLQSMSSNIFNVDIHPAAKMGKGIMIDHASGIVIGETAVIEDDVSMLHGVTLGGTGKEHGDRHPKIRKSVLIGANATILGNIEIGMGSVVAAGSVVLSAVPAHTTVAGVPARVVGKAGCAKPGVTMEQVPQSLQKLSGTSAENCDFPL